MAVPDSVEGVLLESKRGPRCKVVARVRTYRALNWTGFGLAAYCIVFPFISPAMGRLLPRVWSVCAFKRMTGQPCPLCGLTRAFGALMRGDIRSALAYHPFVLLAASFIVGELVFRAFLLAVGREARLSRIFHADIAVHAVILLAYAVYVLHWMLAV